MDRVPSARCRVGHPALLTLGTYFALATASAFSFAQDVPLPQVQKQSAPVAAVSAECNEPLVPDVKQPVSAPILIAEEPARQRIEPPRETRREPEVEPVAARIPGEVDVTAAEAMSLVQQTGRSGRYEDFAAALRLARRRAEALPVSADRRAMLEALDVYSDIDEIWKYAVTDPIGAFYNNSTLPGAFTRFTQKYPRYAEFIAPFQVTDDRGTVFYPTTETREFLADEAERRLRGVRLPPAPTGVIAERGTRPAPEVRREPVGREPVRRPPQVAEQPPARRPSVSRPRPSAERPGAAVPSPRPRRRARRPVVTEPTEPAAPRVTPEEPVTALPEPTETAPSATVPPVSATPEPTPAVPPEPTTALTAPPVERPRPAPPRPAAEPPSGREGISTNTLILMGFGLIALIAIALMIRALRPRRTAEPIIRTEPETPGEEPLGSDWIDPETRHWIDDVNKQDKPPN